MFSLQTIFGKGDKFYGLLEASAGAAKRSASALTEYLSQGGGAAKSLDEFRLARQREKKLAAEISEALVNTFVGFFKDTSLVAIIGIFDLLGAARAVVVDPRWLRSAATVYLFVAAVYFLFCYVMSHGSRRLEAWWRAREAR